MSDLTVFLEKISISHVILLSLILHAFVLSQPQFLQIWDESIFLQITRDMLMGVDHTPYQLPGIKFFVGSAITLFGDNWFSWRVPSVIFGMLSLFVFYKILCNFTSERNALFATAILSFDTIFFVHSSLFLRDVPLMFFGLFSFYLCLKKKYYLAAITLGFAFLIKETAIFFLIFIAIYHIGITKPWRGKINVKTTTIFVAITLSSFLFPLWIYDTIYTPILYDPVIPTEFRPDGREKPISYPRMVVMESRGYEFQTAVGKITNPIEHLKVFVNDGYIGSSAYHVKNWNVKPTSYPWSWVLPILADEDGDGLGRVNKIDFDHTEQGFFNKGKVFGIYWKGDSNLSLWIVGFWSSLAIIIYGAIKNRSKEVLFLGSGIVSMYVPYLLLSLTGRVMFPYYFLTTVPFVAFGIVILLDKIKNNKIRFASKTIFLATVVAWFVWFYPLKIIS